MRPGLESLLPLLPRPNGLRYREACWCAGVFCAQGLWTFVLEFPPPGPPHSHSAAKDEGQSQGSAVPLGRTLGSLLSSPLLCLASCCETHWPEATFPTKHLLFKAPLKDNNHAWFVQASCSNCFQLETQESSSLCCLWLQTLCPQSLCMCGDEVK